MSPTWRAQLRLLAIWVELSIGLCCTYQAKRGKLLEGTKNVREAFPHTHEPSVQQPKLNLHLDRRQASS